MIYDPARRAFDLKLRILESMTSEEIEEYAEIKQANVNSNILQRAIKRREVMWER